jgi:short-subunit dehydrogenase
MNTTPILTLSNRTGTWLSQWSIMDPESVASLAIDELLQNKEVIIPGKWNRVFLAFDKMLPRWIKEKLIDLQMRKYVSQQALQLVPYSNSFQR